MNELEKALDDVGGLQEAFRALSDPERGGPLASNAELAKKLRHKRVIQVHAVDASGRVVVAETLARERFTAWCAQLAPE